MVGGCLSSRLKISILGPLSLAELRICLWIPVCSSRPGHVLIPGRYQELACGGLWNGVDAAGARPRDAPTALTPNTRSEQKACMVDR